MKSFFIPTRKGNKVQVFEIPPLTLGEADQLNKEHRKKFPSSERRAADSLYNCFGMVFISRWGWVNDPTEVENILTDNSWRMIARLNNAEIDVFKTDLEVEEGDVVIYKQVNYDQQEEVSHTGITVRVTRNEVFNLKLLSKLGNAGEYLHNYLDNKILSLYGNIIEIWTDRP